MCACAMACAILAPQPGLCSCQGPTLEAARAPALRPAVFNGGCLAAIAAARACWAHRGKGLPEAPQASCAWLELRRWLHSIRHLVLLSNANPCAIRVQSQYNAMLRCVVWEGFPRTPPGGREGAQTNTKTTHGIMRTLMRIILIDPEALQKPVELEMLPWASCIPHTLLGKPKSSSQSHFKVLG